MKPRLLLSRLTLALLLSVILLSLAACGSESGESAPSSLITLAKTGQTTCYDVAGATTSCVGTGQDGESQTGVAGPSTRFVVGTGTTVDCVTDNLTGLMWTQNANLLAGTGASTTGVRIWQDALTFANDLTLCGFSDWRLPNRRELFSLINYGLVNNATTLNTLGFSNVQASYYWSSSSFASSATLAWNVGLNDGYVLANNKFSNAYVWPVRAGQ